MDVNGSKYHLLYGPEDWGSCLVAGQGQALAALWEQNAHPRLEWDADMGALRLAREVVLFPRSGRTPPLNLGQRRGAGRDRYGNWYWIDPDESGIRYLANGRRASVAWWTYADAGATCVPGDAGGAFTACQPARPPALLLRGLAVTTRHYLVVGDVTEHGLLIWDLHRGGPPLLVRWPADVDFTPWDLAPTPDGGVLVLDRDHLAYWALDQDFRLLATVADDQETIFQPSDPHARRHTLRGAARPQGIPLGMGSPPGPLAPISIESGPDGTVLILDTDPARPYSLIYEYQDGVQQTVYSLEKAVEAVDPREGEGSVELFSVVAHDFAYSPTGLEADPTSTSQADCGCPGDDPAAGGPAPRPTLYVGERDGKQAFAFRMERPGLPSPAGRGVGGEGGPRLVDQRDFLPLRRWGGKGLVGVGGGVFYDFEDRWVPLQIYTECHYAGQEVITTPTAFPIPATLLPDFPFGEIPGRPFDGGDPGCVWHRLFLDAQIPPGTAIQVRARAADDPDLLLVSNWLPQPDPYERTQGAEIPFFDPWADRRDDTLFAEGRGTWELLFQGVRGRYLQLELTILGTGRSTPALRGLRAWYPRFSYPEHYLPAIYREDPAPADFFERWLANFEGFYTNLEDRIEQVAAMFDPRTTPPDTLDWLACWFGLILDPLWSETRRRFFIRHADQFFRRRGTVPGTAIAVRLYLDDTLDERLFDPRCWDQSKVRIVERFMTRQAGGLLFGDPTQAGASGPLTPALIAAAAHRFTVLVPHDLTDQDHAMVQRIVDLEKPAHTAFELKRYWDMFLVGAARIGLDTQLGCSSRFCPLLLGDAYLPDSYLVAPYPFDIGDRLVLDRDRLGQLPAL